MVNRAGLFLLLLVCCPRFAPKPGDKLAAKKCSNMPQNLTAESSREKCPRNMARKSGSDVGPAQSSLLPSRVAFRTVRLLRHFYGVGIVRACDCRATVASAAVMLLRTALTIFYRSKQQQALGAVMCRQRLHSALLEQPE